MFKHLSTKNRNILIKTVMVIMTLVVIALVRIFQVHEAGGHVPIMAGIGFGLPFFMGDTTTMTKEQVLAAATEAGAKEAKSIGVQLTEKMKEVSGFFTEFKTAMDTEIKSLKDSMKPEDVAKRVAAISGEVARDQLMKMTKDERDLQMASFCAPVELKYKGGKGKATDIMASVQKGDFLTPDVAGEGGNVTSVAYLKAVQAMSLPASVVLQDADIIPFPAGAKSMKVPTGLGRSSFAYGGPGSRRTTSVPTFGLETIEPKLGFNIIPLAREMFDMENVGLLPYLSKMQGEDAGKDVDVQVIHGGDLFATGLMDSPSLLEVPIASTGFAPTMDELLGVPGKRTNSGDYKFYFHPSVLWASILNLKDGNGQYVFKDLWATEQRRIFGFESRECQDGTLPAYADAAPDTCFGMLCDMKQAVKLGQIGTYKMEVSTEGSITVGDTTYHAFQDGLVLLRVERYLGGVFPNFSTVSKYPGIRLVSHA